MAGRGVYQRQLSALIAAATADNLTFDDILPDHVKQQFQELVELKGAQEYINDLEDREKKLQGANDTLTKNLDEMQMQLDNLPDDHVARKIELQQAHRQITLQKEVSEDYKKRAERYQNQLNDFIGRHQAIVSTAENVEDLRAQVEDHQAVIAKLMYDNRQFEKTFGQLREADKVSLERKDKQLAKKDEQLADKEALIKELYQQIQDANDTNAALEELDPFALQEQNLSLLSQNLSLSEENQALQDRNNIVKEQLGEVLEAPYGQDRKAQLFAAAISETKTLNRFYMNAFQVLDALSQSFHAGQSAIPSRAGIDDHLDLAQEALSGYQGVKKVVRALTDMMGDYDPYQVALCKELDSMAVSAADAMGSLETLNQWFWDFLGELSDDPKMLSDLNATLCDAGRLRALDTYGCD